MLFIEYIAVVVVVCVYFVWRRHCLDGLIGHLLYGLFWPILLPGLFKNAILVTLSIIRSEELLRSIVEMRKRAIQIPDDTEQKNIVHVLDLMEAGTKAYQVNALSLFRRHIKLEK